MRSLAEFQVVPVGKPRITRFTDRRTHVGWQKYLTFKRALLLQAGGWAPPKDNFWVTFFLPMPKSWSKKKRAYMHGEPHRQKPDIDNLLKAFLDCFGEDKEVADVRITKEWTLGPGAISVEELESFDDTVFARRAGLRP